MKKIDKTKMIYIALAVFMVGLFLFFSYSRIFDEFESSTYDFRCRLRPPQNIHEDIVIVEIGDDSIDKIGKWPFPRNYHALLVKALKSAGAKTIIFDVFFSEEKPEDEAFAEAVREAGNVYIAYVFELDRETTDKTRVKATGYAAPLIGSLAEAAKGTGFVNVEPDRDGKVRRIPPFIEYDGRNYPHLTMYAALHNQGYTLKDTKIFPEKTIVVGDEIVIPLGERSSMLVNYPGVWGSAFRHYSYIDILQSYLADVTGQEPILDLKELDGAVCFIGLTATASPDAHPSPLERLYPGIGVHTSVYNSMMNNSHLRRLNKWWNLLILALMWISTAYITLKSRKRFAVFSIFLIILLYLIISSVLFWPFGIWIDVFYPIVTIGAIYVIFTFKKYIQETQKREIIEKELDIATEIQQSFLPKEVPDVGGMEVSVKMITARQVGGDLYDMVQLDDKTLGIMLGDVSGKGVPAALYMARVVSVFKTYVRDGAADVVLKKLNDRLVNEASSNLFVTLTFMIFDTEKNEANFAIGGHLPTILLEPDGEVKLLDVDEGMPIGLIESGFARGDVKYKPGSIFILYTDGVTEAMDIKGEMFEEDRLVSVVKKMKGKTPEEIVDAILKAVKNFEGKAKQHDDITVMAIKT